MQVSGGVPRLNPVEDRVETWLIRRIQLGHHDHRLGSVVRDAIFKVIRGEYVLGFFPFVTRRIRNMIAASVVVDPEVLSFVLNYQEWNERMFPYPAFHGIVIGALEGLVKRNEAESVMPNEPGLVGDFLGSSLACFPSAARERSWLVEMETVTDINLEQSLGQLVAKVIEVFGDTFVFAFLRPFTSFEGGFPKSDLVGFVEQVVRQVTIKYLARRPTPALLQLCTGSLATEQH